MGAPCWPKWLAYLCRSEVLCHSYVERIVLPCSRRSIGDRPPWKSWSIRKPLSHSTYKNRMIYFLSRINKNRMIYFLSRINIDSIFWKIWLHEVENSIWFIANGMNPTGLTCGDVYSVDEINFPESCGRNEVLDSGQCGSSVLANRSHYSWICHCLNESILINQCKILQFSTKNVKVDSNPIISLFVIFVFYLREKNSLR